MLPDGLLNFIAKIFDQFRPLREVKETLCHRLLGYQYIAHSMTTMAGILTVPVVKLAPKMEDISNPATSAAENSPGVSRFVQSHTHWASVWKYRQAPFGYDDLKLGRKKNVPFGLLSGLYLCTCLPRWVCLTRYAGEERWKTVPTDCKKNELHWFCLGLEIIWGLTVSGIAAAHEFELHWLGQTCHISRTAR